MGIVALIWPYSSSQKAISILLAEPDFRLRHERGQVRLHFSGPSAQAMKESGLSIGDEISLALEGAEWVKGAAFSSTPGKGIDWELRFRRRLVLQVWTP